MQNANRKALKSVTKNVKEGRFMKKIKLGMDGMMCGMCETHINNCVRRSFNVKSVKSSHLKNETVIIAEDGLNEAELKAAIEKTGYKVTSVKTEEYKKKGLFGLFGKCGGIWKLFAAYLLRQSFSG